MNTFSTKVQSKIVSTQKLNCSSEIQPSTSNAHQTFQDTSTTTSSQTTSSQTTSSQTTSQGSNYSPQIVNRVVETVTIAFDRVISTHAICFLCRSKHNLQDVPFEARIQVFVKKRIFIPKRYRCCSEHLIQKRFYENELNNIKVYLNESCVELNELKKCMDRLSKQVDHRLHDKIADYSILEERVKALTGHTWETIISIRDIMMPNMRDSVNRNILEALVIFLFKMRSGNSDNLIAAVMEVKERVVNDSVNSVLNCFKVHILPKYFGMHSKTREFFINNTSEVAKHLYDLDDRLVVICDGTYLRHEKSSNNAYQKKSYSGQKKTNLCKPFAIFTTNGYIIDLSGPFEANLNDAEILKHLILDPIGLSTILKPGDIFILDRGFRYVKSLLMEKGYIVLMPALRRLSAAIVRSYNKR